MKVRWIPLILFGLVSLIPGLALSQAGFGGPGTELGPLPRQQEGGGFSGGGGGGSRWSENYQAPRRLILTPGQTIEIKVTTTRPMVGTYRASSEVFDPRIEVRDRNGKVLAENDDRVPGSQDAFVRVFLPEQGEYTVVVRSFKDAAGGPAQVSSEMVPATFVTGSFLKPLDLRTEPGRSHVLVFEGKKDVPLGATLLGLWLNFNESDEGWQPTVRLGNDEVAQFVYVPKEDETVFLPVALRANRPAFAMLTPVRRQELPASGEAKVDLAPGEITEVTLPTQKPGLWEINVVDTQIPILGGVFLNRGRILGINPGLSPNSLYPFLGSGGGSVMLANPTTQPTTARLQANLFRKPVAANSAPSSFTIAPGDFQVHSIPVESGDTIQYTVESRQFVLAAALYSPFGQLAFQHEDRARSGRLVGTWMTVIPGDLSLQVHALGHGGGGAYRLSYARRPPVLLTPRTWHRVGESVQALRIRGRAGQPFVIWIKSDLAQPIALFGPTGGRIFSNDPKSFIVRPVLDGDYTILPQVPGDTQIRWVPQDD